jgi:CBS domain-containing protein
LDRPLSDLMSAPVVVSPADPVRTVARLMTETGVSAAVVLARAGGAGRGVSGDGEGALGIVTDADLRARHLAAGVDDQPVGAIATPSARTLGSESTVAEALALMTAGHLHHIPVVSDGRLVGLVDAAAVVAVMAGDPMTVLATASKASDLDQLAAARDDLPGVVARLVAAGTGGLACVRLLSLFTEAAMTRIVVWATDELGPPPAPYALVALGSLARREQTLVTDQDHALVVADGAGGERWYAEFGERVTDDLATVGFPRCPGGVMVANAEWRDEQRAWHRRWEAFLAGPEPDHILASNIVLDARTVVGDPALASPFRTVAERAVAGNTGPFLLFLVNSAREHGPPLGLFNRWKTKRRGPHAGRFDVKAGAVLPIVSLARVHGIAAGSGATGTVDRLGDAARAGKVSADTADILVNGYELVTSIRLLEQTGRWSSGRDLDNWIAPGELTAWQRTGLREVCRTIRTAQEAISLSYLGAYV